MHEVSLIQLLWSRCSIDTSKCWKTTNYKRKNQKLITDIGGGWCLEKCQEGLPLLKRTKLSKKAQKRHDLIKNKLFQYNIWWNNWKFQLHWNMLEWVDPKTTPKRVKPFSDSSKSSILIIKIEQLILLVILNWLHWILLIFMKGNRRMKIWKLK